MNSRAQDSPGCASPTVTEDLLYRLARSGHWPPGTASESLLVTYVRAAALDVSDPRRFVLRPEVVWTLTPGMSLGFGRAPDTLGERVDLTQRLEGEEGALDSTVPRLAGRLYFEGGLWRLTTHSTGEAALSLSAPGLQLQISNQAPVYAVRNRRLMISVPSTSRGDGGGETLEHRFTLFNPRIPEDASRPASTDLAPGVTARRSPVSAAMDLNPGQVRFLAAWAYPELLGLMPAGFKRGLMARHLLRQSLTGPDRTNGC